MNKQIERNLSAATIYLGALCAAFAQPLPTTTPGLELELYAGLRITGSVGTVYSVEYVTDLAQTNNWRNLAFLQPPATNYLWFDPTAPAIGKRFYRAAQFEAPTNLVFIPPGTFRMGSPTNEVDRSDNEGPQTAVTISRGFWMGKYPVTQGEYLAVMGSNPSYFQPPDATADTNRPVDGVSWDDAANYCAQLTQLERGAGRITPNSVYRLPTEAEWEYACRAWTSTRFSYGDDPGYTNLTRYAWYSDNSGVTTHPVGQKLPNLWGLYDMHGNVVEWCQDWPGIYPGGIALDPQGPPPPDLPPLDLSDNYHVLRGGRISRAGSCRSAVRTQIYDVDGTSGLIGFRVLLAPGQP